MPVVERVTATSTDSAALSALADNVDYITPRSGDVRGDQKIAAGNQRLNHASRGGTAMNEFNELIRAYAGG